MPLFKFCPHYHHQPVKQVYKEHHPPVKGERTVDNCLKFKLDQIREHKTNLIDLMRLGGQTRGKRI